MREAVQTEIDQLRVTRATEASPNMPRESPV
jgi:hypothetical protein